LGIKKQASQPSSNVPVLDQSLIDSLLANDSYNFLVHKALDAGLDVTRIEAERSRLANLRDNMKSFLKSTTTDQSAIILQTEASLKKLEVSYLKLTDDIKRTQADFARQQYANAIRISEQIHTASILKDMILFAGLGALVGVATGGGLSLLDIVPRLRN
jgi:hypothetical protein